MTDKEIIYYKTGRGREPFKIWLKSIKDKVMRARIVKRLERVSLGNYGDVKAIGAGVSELRLHFGPGYRVYLAEDGDRIVVLLTGGDKGSQSRDIEIAQEYWKDYLDAKEEA